MPVLLIIVLTPYLLTIIYHESDLEMYRVLSHKIYNYDSSHVIPLRKYKRNRVNTTSKLWPIQKATSNIRYQRVWANLTESLTTHLKTQKYACLCMHHLQKWTKTTFRICGTHLRGTRETLFLINPTPKAISKDMYTYQEQSVACGNETVMENNRAKTFILDWFTPNGERISGAFYGLRAACFLLALEEMDGTIKC
jgi:peptide deformylase